jgi:hypothetical protein
VVEIVNVMNKKSILDRDNVELYIMSEEDEAMLAEILLEDNNDIELKEWQKEILKKEIGDD